MTKNVRKIVTELQGKYGGEEKFLDELEERGIGLFDIESLEMLKLLDFSGIDYYFEDPFILVKKS